MQTKTIGLLAVTLLAQVLWFGAPPAAAQTAPAAKDPYPTMAPLDQYLIADQKAEIALARTAAPPSISDDAEIRVLGKDGYTTVVPGKNCFMFLFVLGLRAATDNENFWNPKLRAPHCFNAAATRTFVPIFLMK